MRGVVVKAMVFALLTGLVANADPAKLSAHEFTAKMSDAIEKKLSDDKLIELYEQTEESARMNAVNGVADGASKATLLHKASLAAVSGNDAALKFLLRKGANIDVKDANGDTPMMTALYAAQAAILAGADKKVIVKNASSVVKELGEYGANPSIANNKGKNAVALASDISPDVSAEMKKFTGLGAMDANTRRMVRLQKDMQLVDADRKNLRGVIADLEKVRDGLKADKANLTVERDGLKVDKTNLTTERDGLKVDKTNLTTERDGLKVDKANLTTERDGLKVDKANLTTERDGLKVDKTNLTTERDGLKVDKDKLAADKAKLQGQKFGLQVELVDTKVRNQIDKAASWLRENIIVACHKLEVEQLKEKNRLLDKKVVELDAKLLEKKNELTESKKREDALKLEIDRLKGCVTSIEKDKTDLKAQATKKEIERIIASFNQQVERLCTGYERTKSDFLQTVDKAASSMKNQWLEGCVRDLQKKNAELKKENGELQNELLMKQIIELRAQFVASANKHFIAPATAIITGLFKPAPKIIPTAHE